MKKGECRYVIFGDHIVSVEAAQAIMDKYALQPDRSGNYQIKKWMVEEMKAWDRANNNIDLVLVKDS